MYLSHPLATHMHTLNSKSQVFSLQESGVQRQQNASETTTTEKSESRGCPSEGITMAEFSSCVKQNSNLSRRLCQASLSDLSYLFSSCSCRAPLCLAKAPGTKKEVEKMKTHVEIGERKDNIPQHILPDLNNSD